MMSIDNVLFSCCVRMQLIQPTMLVYAPVDRLILLRSYPTWTFRAVTVNLWYSRACGTKPMPLCDVKDSSLIAFVVSR